MFIANVSTHVFSTPLLSFANDFYTRLAVTTINPSFKKFPDFFSNVPFRKQSQLGWHSLHLLLYIQDTLILIKNKAQFAEIR